MGNRNPHQEPTTENAKVRKSAFVLRGGSCSVCVPLYITKRSEAVLQWGKRKNIKKMMINDELVVEWKKERSIKDVVVEKICYD